jgi:uncharacterized protein with ATP-grasp and redox domains
VYQAAELATSDTQLRSRAIEQGLTIVERDFSYDVTTISIATEVHKTVKEITGNQDPYRRMKDEEIRVSRKFCQGVDLVQDFRSLLQFSALGNCMDFFRGGETIKRDMSKPVKFFLDDVDRFKEKLDSATELLYLADNTGEVLFDLPLVKWLERMVRVTFVVKEAPAANDITLADLRRCGIDAELRRVITTGTATPGVILSQASEQFRRELTSADLVLAKGMGYYEALSEFPGDGRILFCFMAKCKPVADSLGVPLHSYVASMSENLASTPSQ